MMHLRPRTGLAGLAAILCLWSALLPAASAQTVDTSACLTETYNLLAHEKRVYRSVIFGQKKSEDLPIGSVRYSVEGDAWIKKNINSWNSLGEGYAGTTWSDGLMDDQSDVEERRGILEIRKTPSSDLIPAITQTFRAYQCRLIAACIANMKSQSTASGVTMLKAQPAGCIEFDLPVLPSCKNNIQATVGTNTCDDIVASMLEQEEQTLSLLIAYDASYRTLYQFEGIFEGFLEDFRFPLIEPLWQTVKALGGLAHIPCFLSQCDE